MGVSIDGDIGADDHSELDAAARKNLAYLAELRACPRSSAPRKLRLKFLASPVELLGGDGRVRALRVEENELVVAGGAARAKGTGRISELSTGVVIRSVGYRGVPLAGLPFDTASGTLPTRLGRVLDTQSEPILGLYAAGWIKRGPTGLVGTNKACAKETAEVLLSDAERLRARELALDVPALLAARAVRVVGFAEYRRIDALERSRGEARGKVRDKLVSVADMLAAAAATS